MALTFLSWMTMFISRSICLSEAPPSNRSAIEMLFLIARYRACCRLERGHGMVTCRGLQNSNGLQPWFELFYRQAG
jgi:hypothetical protein